MNTETQKSIAEKLALEKLIDAMNLPIEKNSIEKQPAGQPDLICRDWEGNYREFEIVRLIDEKISRAQSAGLNAKLYIRTADPTTAILNKKLSRNYQIKYSVDLLIYTDGRIVTPDSTIIPTISFLLTSKTHIFKNIWFMGNKQIVRLWPSSSLII